MFVLDVCFGSLNPTNTKVRLKAIVMIHKGGDYLSIDIISSHKKVCTSYIISKLVASFLNS